MALSVHDQAFVVAAWGLGHLIFVMGLDDILVDILAHWRMLRRSLTIYRKHRRATAAGLPDTETPMAILLPAWREEAVLRPMLLRLRATLDYQDYRVYVGVYPNDPETRACLVDIDPEERWLRIVINPLPGPTSKADCLNRLWEAARRDVAPSGAAFAAFVLHDAEDLVDPLECRLFSALIGRADMVQLPVIPLSRSPYDLIAGHYLDEFAETHQKDMVLREALAGGVPSAGVGCAFSRRALLISAHYHGGAPFPTGHMTEDYALALRLQQFGMRTIFVRLPQMTRPGGSAAVIATREYFPNTVRAAIRQKSRWLIGIAIQTWADHGWRGGPGLRLMLYRDRKALVTPFIAVATNLFLLWSFLLGFAGGSLTLLFQGPHGGYLSLLLQANCVLLLVRVLHRAAYVRRLYGTAHALMSAPRIVVGNLINCGAAIRAIYLYARHRATGQALIWDKTAHHFPAPEPAE